MGSYTPIVTSAAAVTAKRRRLRVDAAHGRTQREESTFAFACPECGEGSAVQPECPRCHIEMRDTACSVELPRRAHARSAVGYSASNFLVPIACILGVLGVAGLFVFFKYQGRRVMRFLGLKKDAEPEPAPDDRDDD